MKIIAIIINIFFPGVGTLIVGKIGTGVIQIILTIIAAFLSFTGFLSIIGIPLGIGVWIWALVSVAGSNASETIVVKEVVREVPVEKKKEINKMKKQLMILAASGMLLTSIQAKDSLDGLYVGMQYSHTAFGLSAKADVAPKIQVQGIFGLTGSDDIDVYAVRAMYKLTEDRDYYTYGFGSLSLWKYKTLKIDGMFSSSYEDDSSVGFGLGVGLEYDMKKYTEGLPFYWNIELGYDSVEADTTQGSFDGADLSSSVDLGGFFIGSGFHYKF